MNGVPDPEETMDNNCPRCDSPAPNLHPAIQHEGEVEVCPHDFHGDRRQRPGESLREMSLRLYGTVSRNT